jgi:hypothetical protein
LEGVPCFVGTWGVFLVLLVLGGCSLFCWYLGGVPCFVGTWGVFLVLFCFVLLSLFVVFYVGWLFICLNVCVFCFVFFSFERGDDGHLSISEFEQ